MTKSLIINLFFGALFVLCGAISVFAQTNNSSASLDTKMQEIKDKITKIGVGGDITIIDQDGREFYGSVREIGASAISINEVDQKVKVEIDYARIKKVRKDYGATKGYNGRRIPTRRNFISLAVGVAAIILIPAILLATAKD